MNQLWFTADTHFGHVKVIDHCSRPFASVEDMDEALIERWNARVGIRDEVWHLGDFAFRAEPAPYYPRLNGRISFVFGNHDDRKALVQLVGERAFDVKYLRHNGQRFFLSHYAHRAWPGSHHGTYHLFGHSHGGLPNYGRSMDVGVDCHNYAPVSVEEVITTLSSAAPTPHHEAIDA